MVKIIWETETLKKLKLELHIDNLKDYLVLSKKLKLDKDRIIMEWKEECKKELIELKKNIALSRMELEDYLINNQKVDYLEYSKSLTVIYNKARKIWKLKDRIELIESDFEEYSIKKVENKINDILTKEKLIKSLKSVYYWAIWEEKVVDEFKNMSCQWILINDFKHHFNNPLFKKWSKGPINSIQIDHIFINDKGIFLIETKNWSDNSWKKFNFWPIEQIDRSWHAFYIYLRDIFQNDNFLINQKIPTIYKLVVFIRENRLKSNNKFINVLNLNDLRKFISRRLLKINIYEYSYIWDILINENKC